MRHRQLVIATLSVAPFSGMLPAAARADDHATAPLERARAAEARRIDTIERVLPSVVCVLDASERGAGSGVLIDPLGYGLTNYHVIAGLLDTRRGSGGLADGVTYELEVLGIDVTGDVAMFRLIPPQPEFTFPCAELGDSDAVRVGDTAIAIGNPFALAEDYTPTVTLGIVTGVHRYQWGVGGNLVYSDCLQVDAPINPGNSGGPLFNAAGEVIGINGRISVNTRGRYNVGFGYAISSNQIKRFIPALRAGLLARHGTWQATVEEDPPEGDPTPPEASRALDVDADVGRVRRPDTSPGRPRAIVRFNEVRPQGPAYEAGVRVGDSLLSLNGTTIHSANQVGSLLGTYPANWPVRLLIEREGKPQHLIVRLDPVDPKMRRPFEVDRDVNRRAVRRVLRSFRRVVLGNETKPRPTHWKWIAERRYHPLPDGTIRRPERYDATQSGDGPIRMQQRYDDSTGRLIEFDDHSAIQLVKNGEEPHELPPEDRAVLAAVYTMYRRLLEPLEGADLDAVFHVGADALVAPAAVVDADGGSRSQHGKVEPPLLEVLGWPLGDTVVARFAFDSRSFALARIIVEDLVSKARTTVDLTDYQDIHGVFWPGAVEVRSATYGYREEWSEWELSP